MTNLTFAVSMTLLKHFLKKCVNSSPISLQTRRSSRKVAEICSKQNSKTKEAPFNARDQLKSFGRFVADCLPKYVQKVQVAQHGELEIMVEPDGIACIIQFLKDHHNCQFEVLMDLTGKFNCTMNALKIHSWLEK